MRIGFSSTFGTCQEFFTWALGKRYEVKVVPPNECDYLIFGEGNTGTDHYQFMNCKRILYTGENYRPNYFTHDHAITFDHEYSNKHYRLPLWVLEMHMYKRTGNAPSFDYLNVPSTTDDVPEGFCTFVQSNPNHQLRNEIFKKFNEYKKVDSGGPLFNNIDMVLPRDDIKYKRDFIAKRKFNIAIENGTYPGYCTEKILDGLYAGIIPIYLGSITVDRDFNTDRFINLHDYNSVPQAINAVKKIEASKNEWLDIVNQPVWKNNIMPDCADIENLLDWWDTFVK